jgi:hypothetical protein
VDPRTVLILAELPTWYPYRDLYGTGISFQRIHTVPASLLPVSLPSARSLSFLLHSR